MKYLLDMNDILYCVAMIIFMRPISALRSVHDILFLRSFQANTFYSFLCRLSNKSIHSVDNCNFSYFLASLSGCVL